MTVYIGMSSYLFESHSSILFVTTSKQTAAKLFKEYTEEQIDNECCGAEREAALASITEWEQSGANDLYPLADYNKTWWITSEELT